MSYLSDYLDYATGNEAPGMYHVWCGYMCLSAVTTRRVWMTLDDYVIYPNLYVLLVGGAGGAKTVSLTKAKRIIAELNLPFSGSVETPQGMWRFMTGDDKREKPLLPYGGADQKLFLMTPQGVKDEVHPMNIIASEFINFISLDDKVWINALNDIYDENVYHYRTKGQGEDYIKGPYITLLGGLTTQIAAGMQKEQIINTGLARRTLFQFGERSWFDPHPRPEYTEKAKLAKLRAVEHLKKVREVSGVFEWTPETGAWWDIWYAKNLASVPTRSPSVQGWYATKSTQLMKLAMLTSLSERLDRVLEVKHFELALAYLSELEKDLYKIFGGTGKNELAEVALKIFNYVSQLPEPISGKVLKLKFWQQMPGRRDAAKEFQECIDHLTNSGQLRLANANVGSLTDFFIGTPETMSAFLAQYATPHPQASAGPTASTAPSQQIVTEPESPPAKPASADPSTSQSEAPIAAEPATLNPAQSSGGTVIVPPPMVG